MKETTRQRLLAINERFYREQAEAFASKRQRPWKGWDALVPMCHELGEGTGERLGVLDVGCGHGRFAAYLQAALPTPGFALVGVDASPGLIARAEARALAGCRWSCLDFSAPERLPEGAFDLVVLFGVLHGIPGEPARQHLLRACAERTASGGALVFTTWRALADPRLVRRIRPWSDWNDTAPPGWAIDEADLESGDHLLPWDRGQDAVRYFHAFDDGEFVRQETVLGDAGMKETARFRADGSGGDLNQYFVFRRA